MNQYVKFMQYKQARNYVRKLKIKDIKNWYRYCKSGKKPINIPSKPLKVYKKEWINWAEWLGSNRSHKKLPLEQAKNFVRKKKFKKVRDFKNWKERPYFIPSTPNNYYKNEPDWKGMFDFLGIKQKTFWSYKKASKYTQKLKIKTASEYIKFSATKKRPKQLPSNPAVHYKKEWKGWGDFLGTGRSRIVGKQFVSFSEAKTIMQNLNLKIKDKNEFQRLRSQGKIPNTIPSEPQKIYK